MGFFKSIGKFFTKVTTGISKVVSKIPIIGTLAAAVLPAPLKQVAQAAVAVGNKVAEVAQVVQAVIKPNSDSGGLPAPLPTTINAAQAQGANMALPAALLSALKTVGTGVATALGEATAAGISGAVSGKRRRRRGLTMNEMGKIVFMSQVLGKRNPAVTLMMMKGIGGRL